MKSIEIESGGPGHAEIEVARHGEIAGELRILEMADARRPDAGVGQTVVEPRRHAIAKVRADREVQRPEHLQQQEYDAREHERPRERIAALHGGDEHAHGDRECGGQRAAQQQDEPPRDGQRAAGPRENGKELPLVSRAEAGHERRGVN